MKTFLKLSLAVSTLVSLAVIFALVPLAPTYPLKNRAGVWLYEQGHHRAAEALFRSLANLGYGPATNNLGVLANLGLGTKQRFSEARSHYQAAADAGVAAAKYNLARLYERGLGARRDLHAARALLSDAAKAGDAMAQITLASLAERLRQPDWRLYKESLLRQAAEGGNAEAQFALGLYFYLDEEATTAEQARRSEEVVALWQAAAAQGHAPAQASLAMLYQESDPAQALRWLRAAAEQGEISAQLGLAQRLSRGRGLEPDPAAAIGWYRKAAAAPETGDAPPRGWPDLYAYHHPRVRPDSWQAVQIARTELADLLLEGRGAEADPAAAAAHYRAAAEAGWGEAAVRLAELFRAGRGVPRDLRQTERWLRAAVEAGHVQAVPTLQALLADRVQSPVAAPVAPDG